jgi:hypothetical protein
LPLPLLTQVGYCGQLIIDWVGLSVTESSLGVAWPAIYWWWLLSFAGLVCAGLLTQRQCVKRSAVGRLLRVPVSLLGASARGKYELIDKPHGPLDDATLNAVSTLYTLSLIEMLVLGVYFAVWWACGIVYSQAAYASIGRPASYVIGHLAVLHFTAAVLPVTKHSPWLRALNLDYEVRGHLECIRFPTRRRYLNNSKLCITLCLFFVS